jgi:hypothetical protein
MMHCAWRLLLLPVLLCAADSKIDHVTVAGSDLARMRAQLTNVGGRRLGFEAAR